VLHKRFAEVRCCVLHKRYVEVCCTSVLLKLDVVC
jgi:hypothetical protein